MKSLKDPRSWPGRATLFFSPSFHSSLSRSRSRHKSLFAPLGPSAQRDSSPRRQGLWSLARSLEGLQFSFPDKTEGLGVGESPQVESPWFILHLTKCTGRFDQTGMERP